MKEEAKEAAARASCVFRRKQNDDERRGLEQYLTIGGANDRAFYRLQSMKWVLSAQRRAREEGPKLDREDDNKDERAEMIATVARDASAEARSKARKRGLQDEALVKTMMATRHKQKKQYEYNRPSRTKQSVRPVRIVSDIQAR